MDTCGAFASARGLTYYMDAPLPAHQLRLRWGALLAAEADCARPEQYCMNAGGPRGGPGWRPSAQKAGRISSAMVGMHALDHKHNLNTNSAAHRPCHSHTGT